MLHNCDNKKHKSKVATFISDKGYAYHKIIFNLHDTVLKDH